MQLGTRWAAGTTPPASVPDSIRPAIAELEGRVGVTEARWTLTWLEGRPIAELDVGWEVLLEADGHVTVQEWQD